MGQVTLKPCPFCGGKPLIHTCLDGEVYILCNNRDCLVNAVTYYCINEQMAVEQWNTRTPDPAVTALVEAAKGMKQSLCYMPKHRFYTTNEVAMADLFRALEAFTSTTNKDRENETADAP